MQRILTEEEYQTLRTKADKFNGARESIIKSIKHDTHSIYAEKDGAKIAAFPCTTWTFDMDLFNICKSLDVDIPSNVSVCFNMKNN